MSVHFTLYTRPNCCLCLEAKEELRKAGETVSFSFAEIDITADWEDYIRYKEAIPVLLCGAEEWFRLRFSADEFLGKFRTSTLE